MFDDSGSLSESLMRDVFEAAPDAILVVDEDGRILLCNERATVLSGYTRDELLALNVDLLVPERVRSAHTSHRAAYTRAPTPRVMAGDIGLRALRKDGSEFSAEICLSPLGHSNRPLFMAAVRDITERRHQESRLSGLLEATPDAIIIVNADGKIITVNGAVSRVFGYESGELVGQSMSVLVPDDARAEHSRHRRGYFDAPHPRPMSASPNLRAQHKDGRVFPAEISLNPINTHDGILTVAAVRDVTEQRRLERQVAVSERLDSLGRLASAVAHEINNPLTYVMSNLDFLADEVGTRGGGDGDPEEIEEIIEDARQGAERVRRIVSGLRNFSRSDNERTERVDVRRILDLSCKIAADEIQHRARLIEAYGDMPKVDANETQLSHVFVNLLVNAAHAFEGTAREDNEIRISSGVDENHVIVSVQDNGRGIPVELIDEIFQPFVTTRRVEGGSGLGLPISQNIIQGYGGQINVESRSGEGSTFSVVLPIAVGEDEPTAPEGTAATPRRAKVMLVDDEPMVASAIARLLAKWHDVEVCNSADAALKQLEAEEFDIILCDVMMPGTAPRELHEQISQVRPKLAENMLYLSGGAFTEDAKAFLVSIPHRCLAKPVEIRDLLDAIENSIAAR
ncbi:MAG: PAS domain S-box protein [Myxococcota bacterium]|nr:PAS domain S-box protein [Myxococcota bacterium]MDP7533417.1 PAS domain S-box protein [SAR202 cluster bacterium]